MYKYILVQRTEHLIWSRSIRPPAPASLSRTLNLVLFHSFLPHCSLVHSQTTQGWLATPQVPQPSVDLIHVAATPTICSGWVCTAKGKDWTLVLAELVWDCRSWVASQKQGNKGDSAYHMVNWHHIKALYWTRLVQFEYFSALHRSVDGQVELLKRAEKDQVEQEVVRAYFVWWVRRWPSTSRTQVALEE